MSLGAFSSYGSRVSDPGVSGTLGATAGALASEKWKFPLFLVDFFLKCYLTRNRNPLWKVAKKSGSQKKIEILKNHHSSDSQTSLADPQRLWKRSGGAGTKKNPENFVKKSWTFSMKSHMIFIENFHFFTKFSGFFERDFFSELDFFWDIVSIQKKYPLSIYEVSRAIPALLRCPFPPRKKHYFLY